MVQLHQLNYSKVFFRPYSAGDVGQCILKTVNYCISRWHLYHWQDVRSLHIVPLSALVQFGHGKTIFRTTRILASTILNWAEMRQQRWTPIYWGVYTGPIRSRAGNRFDVAADIWSSILSSYQRKITGEGSVYLFLRPNYEETLKVYTLHHYIACEDP